MVLEDVYGHPPGCLVIVVQLLKLIQDVLEVKYEFLSLLNLVLLDALQVLVPQAVRDGRQRLVSQFDRDCMHQ